MRRLHFIQSQLSFLDNIDGQMGKLLRIMVTEAFSQPRLPLENVPLLHEFDYLCNTILQLQLTRPHDQLGIGRRFVGRRYPGEFLDLARPSPFIKSFHIALLTYCETGLAKNLDEIPVRKNTARFLPVSPKR